MATASILVTEPKSDPWVQRTPAKDEKPEDSQFYARDDKNEGTLYYNGTLDQAADAVFLKVYADDKLIKTESQKLTADKAYAFTVKLKPGLIKYKVEFGTKTGGTETVVQTVTNLVCGDAYLIDGQSNALATDTGEKSPPETSDWIRSYGSPSGDPEGRTRLNLWCNPVWKAQKGEKAELGYWGMELAKRLVASQKIPIFIINGAVGGTRIDQHQRNETNPTDLNTIYGRMFWRVQQARLTHGIRGVLWHQGESDQGADGPDGRLWLGVLPAILRGHVGGLEAGLPQHPALLHLPDLAQRLQHGRTGMATCCARCSGPCRACTRTWTSCPRWGSSRPAPAIIR